MKALLAFFRSLFPHDPQSRVLLVLLLLSLLGALATNCAHAGELDGLAEDIARISQEYEVSESAIIAEAGVQYLRGPAATIVLGARYNGPGDTHVEPSLFLIGQTEDHLGVMGGQVLLVDGFGRLDVGIGLAYMNRLHEQLGSQLNFALMLRYWLTQRSYVAARHFSNSGTTEHNTGIDFIVYGRKF